jgi:hypothetical protein
VADAVSEELLAQKQLYPEISQLRQVSAKVSAAVAKAAYEGGVSQLATPPHDWLEYVTVRMWGPDGRTTRASGMDGGHGSGNGAPRPHSHLRPHAHPSGLPSHP